MESLLIIDDEEAHRVIFRAHVEAVFGGRFEVLEADNSADALAIVVGRRPACIVLDHVLRGENGLQVIHQFKRDLPDCPPIILATCALTEELRRDATALGAAKCLLKPTLGSGDIIEAIRELVDG